jgi:dTDP-4-amino-4,6-dideoxygalactose transaminase
MKVPFLDLPAQWDAIGAEIMAAIEPIGQSARFVMGPAVEEFEHAAAQR